MKVDHMDNDLIIYWFYTLSDIPQESRWQGFDSDLQTLHEYSENFEDVKIRISELDLDAKVDLKLTVPQKHYHFDYAGILTFDGVLRNLIFSKHEDHIKTYFKRDQYFDKTDGYLLKPSGIQFKLLSFISPTPIQHGIIAELRESYTMDDSFIDQIYLGKDDALAAVAEMLTNSTKTSLLGAWYKLAQTPPGMPSYKHDDAFVEAIDLLIKQARPKPLRSHAKAIVDKIIPLIEQPENENDNSNHILKWDSDGKGFVYQNQHYSTDVEDEDFKLNDRQKLVIKILDDQPNHRLHSRDILKQVFILLEKPRPKISIRDIFKTQTKVGTLFNTLLISEGHSGWFRLDSRPQKIQ
jgi:hypothetical protein